MDVAQFDFSLPPELIAQQPARPRDQARLLVVGARDLDDRRIVDLPDLLTQGDLLVFNDTRVLPTRLPGRRGAAQVEVTLHEPQPDGRWRAFARPARKCRLGDRLDFADGFAAEVVEKHEHGELTLAFAAAAQDDAAVVEQIKRHGIMPLPPYIKRPRGGDPRDREDYQTLFARHDGAVAAPTAALHFTPALMAALAARDLAPCFVTLHVGAGTFLPVKAEDIRDHRMHAERCSLDPAAAARINAAKAAGRRVVAVGTTVLRTLETFAVRDAKVAPGDTATRLFITPGYEFKIVDRLLTNFHLPRSTLFMLVAAFAGLPRMQAAYRHAIAERYRFYSYGDACLLTRECG